MKFLCSHVLPKMLRAVATLYLLQVQKVMPNDTVFISIVREPVSQFASMFRYLELDRFISLEKFAAQEPIPNTRFGGVYGQNQQLWDFGMPEHQLTDEQKIKEKVRPQ